MDTPLSSDGVSPDSGTAASPAAVTESVGSVPAAVPQGTASETPSPTPSEPSATPPIGPVPYDRFTQVNRRMQEAERRVKEIQDTYGDVIGIPASQAKQLVEFARQMQADPVATAIQLSEQLMSHPQYGQAMASQAARWLQSRRGQMAPAPVAEDIEPEPDLMAENGQPVYSAPQARKLVEWREKQAEARILQRIAPLEQQAHSLQQERQVAAIREKADTEASQMLETAKSWYGFEKHQEAIAKAFRENPNWDLKDAYIHILNSEILPAMPAQAQAQVVAQLQQKAAAQTMNPAGGAPSPTPDFKGDFLAALKWANQNKR